MPVYSRIIQDSFYELYEDTYNIEQRDGSFTGIGELNNPVFPQSFFAFGLGYSDLVSPDLGHFVASVQSKVNDGYHKTKQLEIVPCTDSTFYGK